MGGGDFLKHSISIFLALKFNATSFVKSTYYINDHTNDYEFLFSKIDLRTMIDG